MDTVILYVDDLMTRSRITQAANGSPVQLRSATSLPQLLELCRTERPRLVLADLDSPRLKAVEAIRTLRQGVDAEGLTVLGFLSHVNGARAAEAKASGFTRVLARRGLVKELPRLLTADPPVPS